MTCAAIGDSIAVGLASFLACVPHASVGRSTSQQANLAPPPRTGNVVISLGSNDPLHPELLRNLRRVRAVIVADRVVWVMPYHRHAAGAVQRVAHERGDSVVDLASIKTNDRVHPASYSDLALKVKREFLDR